MRNEREHSYLRTLKSQLADGKIERREFLRTATLLGLSAGAAYACIGEASADSVSLTDKPNMPRGGNLRIGNRVDPLGAPHAMANIQTGIIARQVFDYLTDTGHDNITRPNLLEGWQPSEDLRTWTLFVRKGVKWKNGRDFTADDVVWNINNVLDDAVGSSVQGLMSGYMLEDYDTGEKDEQGNAKMGKRLWDANAIEKVDDYTVRLNCKEPQLAVPEHLFHYAFVIMDPEEGGIMKVGSNCTGPFELVEYDDQIRAVFKARPDYWAEGPYVDTLEIVHLGDDPNTAIGAIASKQVHGLYGASVNNIDALIAQPHVNFYSATTATTMVARGKCNQPPFTDARVRKALRLAINQEDVAKVAAREGIVGEHFHVSPIHPEYAKLPFMGQDIDEAKRLLAEAGFPDGLDLVLHAPADETWMLNGAQVMLEQWKQAGIRVTLQVWPATQYWELWTEHHFSITNWNHRPLGIMVLGLAYRSNVPWNESSFANPEFDRLLTKAEGLVDVEERRKVMAEIQTIMQEEGPVTQPFWTSIFTVYDKKVKGFQMHPSFYIYGNQLALEA